MNGKFDLGRLSAGLAAFLLYGVVDEWERKADLNVWRLLTMEKSCRVGQLESSGTS